MTVPVVLTPRPFAGPVEMIQPAGRTVAAALTDAVREGAVRWQDLRRGALYVDGREVDRETAMDHVLTEGQVVNVVVHAHGGGRGGGKDIGQILLQVAVIAVSAWVGGSALVAARLGTQFAARVAAAAIMVVGNLAIQSLYGPESAGGKANDRYALQSASNRYRPWEAMPLALGEVVVAPDLAAKTFTRTIGDDVWIYGVLGLHYGPCVTADHKIGDTLISSMSSSDVQIVEHLTPGPRTFSLYPNDTDQLDLQEELQATTSSATPVVRAGSAEGELFEFDFFLPRGLYFAKDDGRKLAASVTVTIRYRPVDEHGTPTGGWASGLTIPLTAAQSDPWRVTRSLNLPMGRYEFEVKRSTLEDTNEKRHTDIAWTAVRAIAFRKPIADETLSVIEFAVRATAVNQGGLAPITCRITPLAETWDTETEAWTSPQPTSNPAALTRWLMTGPAPAKPLSPSQADVGLRRWSELCETYDWTAHLYLIEERSQAEALALLEAAGRASIFWPGSELVASPWVEKPIPRQLFTGVNLREHRWTIAYPDPVHALRVEFANIEQGGEADELYVYADGYGETADPENDILAATLVEALRLEGQRKPERAHRDGRWELGRRKLQRRVDTWQADVEHIACRYGDRVRLAWQRAAGEGGARVRNRRWSGGLVSGLRLDRPVDFEPGEDYCVDLRLEGQLVTGVPVVNPAVEGVVSTREIVFATPRSADLSPATGHMIAFGVTERVSEDVEIVGIEPAEGLTANLTGVRYVAPQLIAAETGPIPELLSRLSRDRAKTPPAPALLGVSGGYDGVKVGFSLPPWRGSPVTGFACRWRPTPRPGQASGWTALPDPGAAAMVLVTPAMRDAPFDTDSVSRVDIEIRALTASGLASLPLEVTASVVAASMPDEGDWSISAPTESESGVSQPGLIVSGRVRDPAAARVTVDLITDLETPSPLRIYDAAASEGWISIPVAGLEPETEHWAVVTYLTETGVTSGARIVGPATTPPLVSPVDPEQLGTAVDAAVAAATEALALAVTAVENAQAALAAALGAAETGLQEAIDAVDTKADGIQSIVTAQGLALADKASISALNAQIARIDTSLASIGTINATLADLPNQYASASQFLSIKSEVEAARGGSANLSGRFSSLATAITDGLALKVDVSTYALLLARVTATEGDISTLEGSVASAASAIADLAGGKVNLSDFTSLSGTVTAQGVALSGHADRLTTVELALPGKVNLSDFTTLQGSVTSQGVTLSAHADRLTAVEIEAGSKAGVTVTNAISARLNSGGDVYASILSAASVAAAADGKANGMVGLHLDVSGRTIGQRFANDGTTGSITFLSDYVEFRSVDTGSGYIRMAGGNLKVFSSSGVDVVTIGIV